MTVRLSYPGGFHREVFCDALSVTSPLENQQALLAHITPYMDGLGASLELQTDSYSLWRLPPPSATGVLRVQLRHQVVVVSISGVMCDQLRWVEWWERLLAGIGMLPHRVTSLHATLERDVEAAPVVQHALAIGYTGELHITRKAIKRSHVQQMLGYYELDDALTGTVYLGTSHADARLVIYDKRKERFEKADIDPGPMTRWEMRFKSGIGITLRDACLPTSVFWHHMPAELLAAPLGVQSWVPSAEGFALPSRIELTPAQLIKRKLESSPDVARLLELAAEAGPHGLDLLVSRLRALAATREIAPVAPVGPEGRSPVTSGLH